MKRALPFWNEAQKPPLSPQLLLVAVVCAPPGPSDHFLQARLIAAPPKFPNDFAKNRAA